MSSRLSGITVGMMVPMVGGLDHHRAGHLERAVAHLELARGRRSRAWPRAQEVVEAERGQDRIVLEFARGSGRRSSRGARSAPKWADRWQVLERQGAEGEQRIHCRWEANVGQSTEDRERIFPGGD